MLSGKVDARVAYDVSLIEGEPKVGLKAESIKLSDLSVRLKGEKQPLARLGLLELRDAEVDAAGRKVTLGTVAGNATRIDLVRGRDGLFNAQRLMGETAAGSRAPPAKAAPPVAAGGSAPPKDWQVEIKRIALDDWGVRLEDQTLAPAVVLNVEPLSLKVEGLSTVKGSKAKLNLQTAVNKRGRVGVVGTLGLAPLAGSLDLDLKAVDLAMLQPYVTEKVNIAITRGVVTSRGRLAFELPDGAAMKGGFKPNPLPATPTIFGSDISGDMIAMTRHNLQRAGIQFEVPLKQIEAQEVKPPTETPGILLTNPPYGERIGVRGDSTIDSDEMAQSFFSAFGTTLKQRFAGWSVFLFTADLGVPKLLRLKESRKTPFFNGALECRLFRFDMVAGFNRRESALPKNAPQA